MVLPLRSIFSLVPSHTPPSPRPTPHVWGNAEPPVSLRVDGHRHAIPPAHLLGPRPHLEFLGRLVARRRVRASQQRRDLVEIYHLHHRPPVLVFRFGEVFDLVQRLLVCGEL